jgi:hypothetical protein
VSYKEVDRTAPSAPHEALRSGLKSTTIGVLTEEEEKQGNKRRNEELG